MTLLLVEDDALLATLNKKGIDSMESMPGYLGRAPYCMKEISTGTVPRLSMPSSLAARLERSMIRPLA